MNQPANGPRAGINELIRQSTTAECVQALIRAARNFPLISAKTLRRAERLAQQRMLELAAAKAAKKGK
jgi:hypothetical protein